MDTGFPAGTLVPPNIAVALDGRLILVGGNHHVLDSFGASARIPAEAEEHFAANHDHRAVWCAERGIRFSHWVFPDPIVFRGSMPPGSVASVLERAMPPAVRPQNLFYPLDVLDGFPERQSRTDTHYSPLGNLFLGAEMAHAMLGLRDDSEIARTRAMSTRTEEFTGDLGAKCSPPVSEIRPVPPLIGEITKASNGLQVRNSGVIQLMMSPHAKSRRKLLVFGGSFFQLLLSELARYWRSIVFLRSAFFHYEMVRAVAPDDILCGWAERFIPATRPDAERPHFLAYPLILEKGLAPEEGFAVLWHKLVNQRVLGSGVQ
ncbi:hypothetical protein [Paracoccus luteus]|uniref:hypothetical protein n=1 Tax=Paracoccus luteus TaxID=2508543 RepID=UPI00106F693F|nr:hypothetical protein [Paracoccus luteus]